MLDYLPEETRNQVLKNKLYLESVDRVHESQKSRLFDIIMQTGKTPSITQSGYIIIEVKSSSHLISSHLISSQIKK